MRVPTGGLRKAAVMAACGVFFMAETARAQLPTINIHGPEPSVFEGNPGGPPVNLVFTAELSSPSPVDVTFLASTFEFGGPTGAISRTTCTTANLPSGADFIGMTNQLFTIPANQLSIPVAVSICPDTQVELHQVIAFTTVESLGILLTNPTNAVCAGGSCVNSGTIVDDDGAPFASVNNVTVKEPFSGSKTATFTVTLSHPHPGFEVRVNFVTRDGSAKSPAGPCGSLADYFDASGTLVFPPNDVSETFNVTICSDTFNESTETFFVDLTSALNVQAGGSATGSILNFALPSFGTFTLDPEGADAQVDEWFTYRFEWTVSVGVWRDLQALELRVRQRDTANVPLWIRWLEHTNTFQLCDGPGKDADAGNPASIRCGPAVVAGSPQVLDAPLGRLDVAGTKVIGSGPTGQSVVLEIPISLRRGAGNRTFDVEVAAESDSGIRDDFIPGGVLTVKR